jgi:hypothetical protein
MYTLGNTPVKAANTYVSIRQFIAAYGRNATLLSPLLRIKSSTRLLNKFSQFPAKEAPQLPQYAQNAKEPLETLIK